MGVADEVPHLDSLAQNAAIHGLQRQVSNLTRLLHTVLTTDPNAEILAVLGEMAEQGPAFEDDLVFAVKNPQEKDDAVHKVLP